MIAITAYKNQLKSRKKDFCYRSVTDQDLSSEQLIQEIIGYNSTITEADARAVLSVLNDRVKHFVLYPQFSKHLFGISYTTPYSFF